MSRTLAVSVQSVAVGVDGTIYPDALEYHVCDMADGAAVVALKAYREAVHSCRLAT